MSYSALDPQANQPAVQVARLNEKSLEVRVRELEELVRGMADMFCGPGGDPSTILNLIRASGDVFEVPWRQLNSRVRTAKVAEARHAVQWIAHTQCCVPNATIARMFGRGEEVIGASIKTAQDRIDVDPSYRVKVAEIGDRCGITIRTP